MMSDRFRSPLRCDERSGRAPVQRLPAALQKAVVRRVVDQCMLEAVARLWGDAVGEEKIRVDQRSQGQFERVLVVSPRGGVAETAEIGGLPVNRDVAQKAVREVRPSTAAICAASRADPSRSRRAANDCRKVGGIAFAPPPSPRSRMSRVTSSTKSGTPPARSLMRLMTSAESVR